MDYIFSSTKDTNLSITPFDLEKGNIAILFVPVGKDVNICNNADFGFKIRQKPYWVKFEIEPITKNVVNIINDNINYLSPFLKIQHNCFNKDILQKLSGWDIRLINMFIKRKIEGETFFEINTAGLALSSIKLMFHFLLSEIKNSNYNVTYIVVESTEKPKSSNPIFITRNNIKEVLDTIYNI